jgi:hypothetical protein
MRKIYLNNKNISIIIDVNPPYPIAEIGLKGVAYNKHDEKHRVFCEQILNSKRVKKTLHQNFAARHVNEKLNHVYNRPWEKYLPINY